MSRVQSNMNHGVATRRKLTTTSIKHFTHRVGAGAAEVDVVLLVDHCISRNKDCKPGAHNRRV